ncbi:MAG: hypothetical protein ACPGPF_00030 [Pontibacterium sp.]
MSNIWTKFQSLLPTDVVQLGTVQAVYADGTVQVQLAGAGGTVRVVGSASPATSVLIKNGEIVQQLPAMPQHDVTIY